MDAKNKRYQFFVIFSLLGILLPALLAIHARPVHGSASLLQSHAEVVILADPDDPYYPLAEEIAGMEDAPLAPDLTTALAYQPDFLLWVASPSSFSDAVFVEFGLTMKGQLSAVSTGIITGSSLESARELWGRSAQVRSEVFFAVNAPNQSARIFEGRIREITQSSVETQPLTKPNFIEALRSADYLTFTGHGGNSYLGLKEGLTLTPADIPSLNSPIVATGSCQTVRPWRENSIALRFVDQGVTAYSGFVFSPNEGYLLGEFDELPFRYTWPDFPIGHVIQSQNRGTMQGYAYFPFQYLLGDPRTSLQTEPPYQMVDDRQKGDERILRLENVPAGVIPIRVTDGADYSFVNVPGVTSASERDPFYNSRLQMADVQNDKLLLLVHEGGDLTLQLRKQIPWYWLPLDILFDSLDHTLIFSQQASGDFLALGFSVLPLLWVGWQLSKRRLTRKQVLPAVAFGVVVSVLQGVYVLARLDDVTIISKEVALSPISLVAAFILSMCGALIFFRARSWIGRFVALSVVTFPTWAPMIFGLLASAVINIFSISELGTPLYNYALGLISVGAFTVGIVVSGLALKFIKPRAK